MSHADDVLKQADALMGRHRSFVARSVQDPQASSSTPPVIDEDIPILTEVVSVDAAQVPVVDAQLAVLKSDFETALSAWIAETLPALVAHASNQLVAEIDEKARHTLLPRLQAIIKDRQNGG